MSRLFWRQGRLLSAVAVLSLGIGGGVLLHQSQVSGDDNTTTTKTGINTQSKLETTPSKTPEQLKNDPYVQNANSLSRAFRESAKAAMPSVVTVYSHQAAKKVKADGRENPFGGMRGENPFKGTPFENMVPNFGGMEGQDFGGLQSPSRDGMGSGVIIDKNGIVLTNNHVVEDADTVTIHLSDGREFKATDVKTDPQSDLAVVRFKPDSDLPTAHLGNSDDLEIGDWVIAIGNPFQQEKTVTAGIISGKERQLHDLGSSRSKFLQTDAAINPGNSGGPLVNLTGEVVGINTAIASNSGGYQGVGFAIPINQAKWITEQLIKDGSVHRGYLGVSIGDVTGDLSSQFGVKQGEGAFVSEVFPNTPAAEAKLQDGDVIVKFAGQDVHAAHDVQDAVERSQLNKPEPVEVLRDGKRMTLNVTVKAMPQNYGMDAQERPNTFKKAPAADSYSAKEMGLEVADLSADESDTFHGYQGVIIRRVEPESIAAEKGLRPGMLITKIGKSLTPVHNIKEFEASLKKESLKTGVMFQVRSQGGNHFVVLQAQ